MKESKKENQDINREDSKNGSKFHQDRVFGKDIKNVINLKKFPENFKISREDLLLVINSNEKRKNSLGQIVSNCSKKNNDYSDIILSKRDVTINDELLKVGNYYINSSKIYNAKPYYEKHDYAVLNNPQYLVHYIKEIISHLRKTESINSPIIGYFKTQTDINQKMRAVLIDWVIEVHMKFKLNPETLYLTVNLIDRYLGIQKIDRTKLQLLAVGAMLIATKYEEIYAPEVRDFVYITDKTYSREEILKMEYKILSLLNFDILCIYPFTFLQRYHFVTGADMKSFYLSQYILEYSLMEYSMLVYTPSIKACACLYLSRKLLKIEPSWTKELEIATNLQERDLKICAKDLCKILELMGSISLKACRVKFSSTKYMEVAKINNFK